MEIPLLIALLLAGGLSGLYLLFFRGDEEWYVPIAGAALSLLIPLAVHAVFSSLAPVQSPLYVYGVFDVEGHLEWARGQIHEVASKAASAAKAAVYALEGISALLTAVMIGAAALTGGVGASAAGAVVSLTGLSAAIDPVTPFVASAYNALMGIAMTYHVLEIVADAAVRAVPLLLTLGMALLPLPRARAAGGVLIGLGLLLYAGAMAGGYFAHPAALITQWAESLIKWAGDAPKPEEASRLSSFLLTDGGGIYFARYNASISSSKAAEYLQKAAAALKPIPVNGTPRFINGSDYVSAVGVTPLWNGNATWRGLEGRAPYAVYAWLDVPRFPEPIPWTYAFDYVLMAAPADARFLNATYGEWAGRAARAHANFYNNVTPFWRAYAGPQGFWNLLTAGVAVEVYLANASAASPLYGGAERGVVGVWGWLKPPSEYSCYVGGRPSPCSADVTDRPGLLKYYIANNTLKWARPSALALAVKANFTIPRAGEPVRGGRVDFYRWEERCTWCEKYVNGTCVKWASTSREVREEPAISKAVEKGRLPLSLSLYRRPWEPEGAYNATIEVEYTRREWRVDKEVKYGDWSNGPPPPGAFCTKEGPYPYKRVVLWDVKPAVNYAYAFAWLSSVRLTPNRGGPLPDYYDGGPSVEEGFSVINLLRGAEYSWECGGLAAPSARPNWRLVPSAVANLTALHRNATLFLLAQGEYQRARASASGLLAEGPPNAPLAQLAYGAVQKTVGPAAFFPLPEAEPRSYTAYNVIIACANFDWRNKTTASATAEMEPGREAWIMKFFMGDSRLSRALVGNLSAAWAWVFARPPPPPPREILPLLPAPWPLPWNGWMDLPYDPAEGALLPVVVFMGIPMWPAAELVASAGMVFASWLALYSIIYVALLTVLAAVEAAPALFAFPSAGALLAKFVWQVLEDLGLWYQIRLLVKGRALARLFKSHPVRVAARRAVEKLYRKGYLKVGERRRWELERALTPVGRIERGVEERALERVMEAAGRAEAALRAAGRALGRAAGVVKEGAERAWRIAMCHDVICALREASARADKWLEQRVAKAASEKPLSYFLFWAHFDPHGRWWGTALSAAAGLPPGAAAARGFEEVKNAAEYLLAVRLSERLRALRLVSPADVADAAREAAERATAASLAAVDRLAEALRRGAGAGEVEGLILEVCKPLGGQAAFKKLSEIIAAALGERAPETPRELAELLTRRSADFSALEGYLRRAWAEEWSYGVAASRALALREAERRLGELYLLTLAWEITRGELERAREAAKRGLSPREALGVKERIAKALEAFGADASFLQLLEVDADKLIKALREARRKYVRLAERAAGAAEGLEVVRREAYKLLREAALEILWGRGEAPPGAEEVYRAALRAFVKGAGGEAAARLFREEMAEIKRRYATAGADVSHLEEIEWEVLRAFRRPGALEAFSEQRAGVAGAEEALAVWRAYELITRGEYERITAEAEAAVRRLAEKAEEFKAALERYIKEGGGAGLEAKAAELREAGELARATVLKLRKAEEVLERAPVGLKKAEASLPERADLWALALAFKERVERLKASPGDKRLASELALIAGLLRERPAGEVARAFKERLEFKPGAVEKAAAFAEAWRLAAALAGAELTPLVQSSREKVEELRRAAGALGEVKELASLLRQRPAAEVAEAFKAVERLEALSKELGVAAERLLSWAAEALRIVKEDVAEAVKRAVDKRAGRQWRQRALLTAPIGAYVINAMGLELAGEVFAKYEALRQFGDVLMDISPYVPARLGLPAPSPDPVLAGLAPTPRPYPERVARHIARWDDAGVLEGIRRFYKTKHGLRHKALAEAIALGAKAAAFRRLAEGLINEGRRSGDVYKEIAGLIIAARAAREEARLAERAGATALRERAVKLYVSAVEEAYRLARGLPAQELARGLGALLGNIAESLLRGGDLKTALERLSAALRLEELHRIYGESYIARAALAEHVYRSLAKGLEERPAGASGYAIEVARALDAPVKYQHSAVGEALAAAVPKWVAQRLGELREALRASGRGSAPRSPYARESGFKEAVAAFLEEVKSAAEFSPSARQALRAVAKYLAGSDAYSWAAGGQPLQRDALAKYIGVRMLEALRAARPAEAPGALERLPAALRKALEEVGEEALAREGYYDEKLRAVHNALRLEFKRDLRAAARLEKAVGMLAAKYGVEAGGVFTALRELAEAPLDAERAERAGRALLDFLAKAAEARFLRRASELNRAAAYYDADLAYREVKAVLKEAERAAGVKFAEGAAAEVLGLLAAKRAERGLLSSSPEPFGIMIARDRRTAEELWGRFKVIPLNAEVVERGVWRVEKLYILAHPSLLGALEELLDSLAAEVAKRGSVEVAHLGAAPPEVALLIPGVAAAREGGVLRIYAKYDVEGLAREAAARLAAGDVEGASRAVRRLKNAWLLAAKKYGAGGEDAVGFAVMKELISILREKWLSGDREALLKWAFDPELAPGMLKALGAYEGDPDLLIHGVKRWLEWLAGRGPAPLGFPEALVPAARLYAEVALEPYREVLARVYKRLEAVASPAAERAREALLRELERLGAAEPAAVGRAAGLIPSGVEVVRQTAEQQAAESAELLREGFRRVREEALRRAAGSGLGEYLEDAVARAWDVLASLLPSPEAVRYASLLAGRLEEAYGGSAGETRLLFKPVIEAVARAEEETGAGGAAARLAGRITAWMAREAERMWDRGYKAAAEAARALAALNAPGNAAAEALQPITAAVALAEAGRFKEAVEAAREAARRIYEAAREAFEKAKITLERIYEIIVEAVARVLDYVKAHWFIIAAAAAGLIGWAVAQQLDFTLWQDHVALNAGAIAGLAAEWKVKPSL
ncbi:MAG: hypothetical protein QW680_05350, partial [Pyrobaculum sp.]